MLGLAALAVGVYGLFSSVALTVVSTLWVGILMAAVGVIGLINTARRGQRMLGFVLGAVYLIGGVLIALNPVRAAVQLTLLIAAFLIASGITRIFWSKRRARLGTFAIVGGVVSILLGMLLIAGWPVSGLFAIGLFVAIDLVIFGATALAVALSNPPALDSAPARA